MAPARKNAFLIAVYVIAGAVLLALLVSEFSRSRFDDCMSIGAFSKTQCEEYARE